MYKKPLRALWGVSPNGEFHQFNPDPAAALTPWDFWEIRHPSITQAQVQNFSQCATAKHPADFHRLNGNPPKTNSRSAWESHRRRRTMALGNK
jgi:hypothetical protein